VGVVVVELALKAVEKMEQMALLLLRTTLLLLLAVISFFSFKEFIWVI
jgi:hypothetical protein